MANHAPMAMVSFANPPPTFPPPFDCRSKRNVSQSAKKKPLRKFEAHIPSHFPQSNNYSLDSPPPLLEREGRVHWTIKRLDILPSILLLFCPHLHIKKRIVMGGGGGAKEEGKDSPLPPLGGEGEPPFIN